MPSESYRNEHRDLERSREKIKRRLTLPIVKVVSVKFEAGSRVNIVVCCSPDYSEREILMWQPTSQYQVLRGHG